MSHSLRPPTEADRAAWERLFRAYIAFYEAELPDRQYDLTWRRILGGENIFCLLAVGDDSAPIGLMHWMYHPSTWTDGPYCYLQDLYVDPDARAGGIGRALIERLYGIAAEAGAAQVYWLTQDFNETARHLYDKVGQLTPFIKYKNK
jgi:GNAT superfamily N-acetyltransferase